MAGFEKLDRIVTLDVTYKTLGNLSINTGRGDGIRDNLVIRGGLPGGDPVISGSSVKGVVRSAIEAMLTKASEMATDEGEKARLKVCIPPTCMGTEYELDQSGNVVTDRNNNPRTRSTIPQGRLDPEQCRANTLHPRLQPCPVCRMFGNTASKGRATFHDGKLLPGQVVTTISRTHVAIARDSGIAGGSGGWGSVMTMETVPSGVTFKGTVVLVNPEKWMVGAAREVLEMLPKFGVGAKTTSGYGELDVSVDMQITLRPGDDTEAPSDYLNSCMDEWHGMVKYSYPDQG